MGDVRSLRPTMRSETDITLAALPLTPADAGLAQLARAYASAIDAWSGDPAMLRGLGQQLQSVLAELGATPKARKDAGQAPTGAVPSRLGVFRERATRDDGA